MTDAPMITPDLVRLDAALGADKDAVLGSMVALAQEAGRTADPDQLLDDLHEREAKSATGLPGGIAIPHCRTPAVDVPTLVFARLDPKVDFGAKDGPADLAFMIAAPAGGDADHLKLLAQLARGLAKKDFTDALRAAGDSQEVLALIEQAIPGATGTAAASEDDEAAATAPASAPQAPGDSAAHVRRLVAVTACPTGIAHTYMAAEALQGAAERAGVEITVETQGSAGSTPLPAETIAAADAVIFAVDVGVRDKVRFAGKPVVSSGVKRPIDEGDAMVAEALAAAKDPTAARVEGDAADPGDEGASTETWGGRVRRVLMTGVSYMIPFVAAGGLLIAVGFLLGGYEISDVAAEIVIRNSLTNLPDPGALGLEHALFGSAFLAYLGAVLFLIGSYAFAFLVPALAGYIAYAIADRPGIAPGFILGALASNMLGTSAGEGLTDQLPASGFLGGIAGGVIAGLLAHWIGALKVPAWARGLMPVLVIPLFSTLIGGLVMLLVLARPLAALMNGLESGLGSMSGSSAVLLGAVLGLMMAFDMGGPLNKTAYFFATTGITAEAIATGGPELKVMAAVMLAGMVPPLGLALATAVRPRLFTAAERENGKAAWFLGASFITEGAIPFAAADPLRVIPAIMLGSAVTGGLAEGLDVTLAAPHGGIFVLFAVGNVVAFLLSLLAGTLVAAAGVVVLKSMAGGREPAAA